MATGLTRLDVLQAAENMMSEMRPDQITRQKLASRLGVGTGTISNIVGSMDSLRDELVGREPNRFRATEYAELRERAAQLGYRLTKITGRRV